MKSFKTESKRVLDLMINSIYTHKEIFLRELISNCSDAMDKLYFKSLSEGISGLSRGDFHIDITIDKENRILTISDNGIGMTEKELEENLGTIAKSGSFDFKSQNAEKNKEEDINIIGQFGVGFYSAFMVSKRVEVKTKAYNAEKGYLWASNGVDGYEISECQKDGYGTEITLYIKENTDNDNYDRYLEEYGIKGLVKKYSDYIRYPIRMATTTVNKDEDGNEEKVAGVETLNSMTPLWKKNKNEITKEEYNDFYSNNFYDNIEPLSVIHTSAEGTVEYKSLLYIPTQAPYDYYTKNFEKGLKLYTDGVLIMDKCKDLLPDYFGFVKGLVDTQLTLNISRETIQHNRELKLIANSLEKKIRSELVETLKSDREKYLTFFKAFGLQLKYGLYSDWGMHKDVLQDLVIFHSVKEDKFVTFEEYVEKMLPDQKYIYYATGKSIEGIKALPQIDKVLDAGYDVLCFTDDVDEFAIKVMMQYKEKQFRSVMSDDIGIVDNEENTTEDTELIEFIKDALSDKVAAVKITSRLKKHAICLSSQGEISIDMEKTLNAMPNGSSAKAEKVLEISKEHAIYQKLKDLYANNQEQLKDLALVLYNQSAYMAGLALENPTEAVDLVVELLSK